ncbi:MAG: hypothetical protein WBA87_06105 [Microbacterium sp.]
MSDEVTITSGGAISVDSSALRDIAARLGDVTRHLGDAGDQLRRALAELSDAPDVQRRVGDAGISACLECLADLARQIDKASGGTVLMADTFEVVELRAQQEALSIQRPQAAAALQTRIDELLALPAVADSVVWTESRWSRERSDAPVDQPLDHSLGLAGGLLGALSAAFSPFALKGAGTVVGGLLGAKPTETVMSIGSIEASRRGLGVLPSGAALQGPAPRAGVQQISTVATTAPVNLTETLSRVPYHGAGQVAVEKFTMKDGSTRFVTYIDGTRTVKPGTSEPWDMGSNIDMYLRREQAASQQAVLQALAAAGAQPGDQVDLVGYSQGGAIASFIAMDSPYETGTVIAVGNPTQPALSADQTLVELRHRGDVVSNLATGGAEGGTGSPESFEVIREPDRDGNPIGPHDFEAYMKTADLTDRSGDPRVSALQRDFFGELVQASKVERMEFTASRE